MQGEDLAGGTDEFSMWSNSKALFVPAAVEVRHGLSARFPAEPLFN